MRIRKNAKLLMQPIIPGVGGGGAPSSTSFLICQLNRSPWDDDSFLSQVDDDDELDVNNGSLAESMPTSDSSMPSGESMELSYEYFEKIPPMLISGGEDEEIGGLDDAMVSQPVAKRRRTMWDGLMESRPTTVVPKKLAPQQGQPKKRGRPKKPANAAAAAADAAAAAANPYEFYYYSGFGPSWGKRRRGGKSRKVAAPAGKNNDNDSGNVNEKNGNDNGYANGGETAGSSSTSHENFMSEDDNDDGEIKNCINKKVVVESVVDERLDYIDDDDEEEELYGGSKRVRKPIKARSLKSLM